MRRPYTRAWAGTRKVNIGLTEGQEIALTKQWTRVTSGSSSSSSQW